MNRKGAGIYEIIALVILIIAAWVGDSIGSRYSNIAGIVGMVVLPLALVFLIEKLAWLERELFLGQKPFPLCGCGKCSIDSLPETEQGDQTLRRCQCGRIYDTTGRGSIRIIENEQAKDFAIWKPFKGWQQQ